MRRKEKEIRDPAAVEAVLRAARVCRLGLSDGDQPYIVPLCFGYREGVLYFHGAREGKKIDLLRKNPRVCFELDGPADLLEGGTPCEWSMRYRSVVGFGRARLVEGAEEKTEALGIIMGQYAHGPFRFPASRVAATAVIRVDIDRMTGKQSGFPVPAPETTAESGAA